ncbi:MAG: methyltransferase domain-containing protein [Alphaproteobacteria bacterium]
MAWNAATYLNFADHRTRPAYELIVRIPLDAPQVIYDLGCGPGNSTGALAESWPKAKLIGVDSSREMLAAARESGPKNVEWQEADLADWSPAETPDLLYSNATFQWIGGQEKLLPRLFASVKQGGAFAFQIPANHEGPPHTIIDEVLNEQGLAHRIKSAALSRHVLPQADYFRMLSPLASTIDIWDTRYLQVLKGEDPVLRWIKGTALVPIMAELDEREANAFLELLQQRLAAHYPQESGGQTLFPFSRRFIVALRA